MGLGRDSASTWFGSAGCQCYDVATSGYSVFSIVNFQFVHSSQSLSTISFTERYRCYTEGGKLLKWQYVPEIEECTCLLVHKNNSKFIDPLFSVACSVLCTGFRKA